MPMLEKIAFSLILITATLPFFISPSSSFGYRGGGRAPLPKTPPPPPPKKRDIMDYIAELPTNKLVNELKRRKGTESHVIGQTASANIKVDGPATVLVIKGNQVKNKKSYRQAVRR